MKKKYLYVIILVIIVVLVVASQRKGYQATKLTDPAQVPDRVKNTLQDTALERGVYYFAETFTGESAYLVFCGGQEFVAGYDVEITDLTYNYLIDEVSGPPIKLIYGFYKVDYQEKKSAVVHNYGLQTAYPVTIYQINGRKGQQAWPVLPTDSNLEILKWWGLNAKELDDERITFEVIESREQAPKYFDNLRINPISKMPGGRRYDNIQYFVFSEKTPFTISLESLAVSRSINGTYLIDVVIAKHEVAEAVFKSEGGPYAVLRITQHKENQFLRKVLLLEETLAWRLIK